jgi:hypothetical protein
MNGKKVSLRDSTTQTRKAVTCFMSLGTIDIHRQGMPIFKGDGLIFYKENILETLKKKESKDEDSN